MNDFTAIFEFLATVVAKLVDLTINVACGAFLIASAITPWRWPEIFHDTGKFLNNAKKWKELCFESFVCTVLDCIKIPLVCLGFFSPYRWFATIIILFNTFFNSCINGVSSDRFDNRFTGFLMIFVVCADLLCFPLIFFSLINPFGRQFVLCKAMIWQDTPISDYNDDARLLRMGLNKLILKYSLQSIMDIGVVMLSLICLFVPTIWQCFYLGVAEKISKPPSNLPQFNSTNERKRYCRLWNDWFEMMREHFFAQFLHGCIDIGVSPFFAIAALAPYRNRQLIHAIAKSRSKYAGNKTPSAPSDTTSNDPSGLNAVMNRPEVEIVPIPDENGNISFVTIPQQSSLVESPSSTLNRNRYEVGDFDYEYDYELRTDIFYIGLLGLSDLLLLPMLLPLYITQYRYNSIKDDIFNDNGVFGHRELFTIASQFFMLLLDFVYLSWSIPLIFFTILRWKPVLNILSQPELFRRYNRELYLTILKQLGLILLDVIFFPLLLVVLISSYRREEIVRPINHPATMEDGCRIHYLITCNFLMIIHDIIFFMPCMIAMLVFAPHRLPMVVHFMFYRCYVDYDKLPSGQQKTDYRVKIEHDNRLGHDWDNRFDCWAQFFSGIVDLPFLAMGMFTMITIWRGPQLYSRLSKIEVANGFHVKEYLQTMNSAPQQFRRIILQEFAMLFVDFVCLLPLAVIVCTLYRIPELYNSFCNALRSGALKSEALFSVISVAIDYPVGSNDPTIKFLIHGDHTLDKSAFDNFELHVLGKDLWEETSRLFGGLVAGVAKSYLPLVFNMEESIGLDVAAIEIVAAPDDIATSTKPEVELKHLDGNVEVQKAILQSIEECSPSLIPSAPPIPQLQTSEGGCLWLRLPLKGVKKSTVIKKMRKFNDSVPMIWQLECDISSTNDASKARRVMFRYVVPVKNVVSALECEQDIPISVAQPTTAAVVPMMGESPSFVDEYHLLVLKVVVQILLDAIHAVLFFATFISPTRFYKLVKCMLEQKGKTDTRLIEKILFSLDQAEMHLRSYRSALVPTLNTKCKEEYAGQFGINSPHHHNYYSMQRMNEELQKVLNDYDYSRYKSLCAAAKRDLNLLDINSDEFSGTVSNMLQLHDNIMTNWFLKYGVWIYLPFEILQRSDIELASLVYNDEHDFNAKKLVLAKMKLLNIYSEENYKVLNKKSKAPGFLKRTSDQNRSLIRSFFRGMLTDLVGLLMICLITVTIIRFVPTVRDLVQNFFSSAPLNMRSLLTKQCRILRHQLFYLGLSVFYIGSLIITVVGLPPFLADIPNHMHTLPSISLCAEKHLKRFVKNLWKLLSLITVFRTYRMIMKCILYCALLPGAFIGDTIKSYTAELKFTVGTLIYLGILIACITTSARLNPGKSETDADTANDAILGISATICIVLIILGIFKLSSSDSKSNKSDFKRLNFSWSHIIGVAIGPLDCLQLSAVIMYFFWNSATVRKGSPVTTVIERQHLKVGDDHLSGIIFWNSEEADHSSVYRSAMSIAVVLIFFWALLIALPIAQGGAENSTKKNMKMLKVRNAPVYDALFMILSNSLSVWIMATLMRSWSCVEDNGQAVLSSSAHVSCGGGQRFWAGAISFSFLSYYVVTSALVYSDSSTNIESDTVKGLIEHSGYVRFSSSYATFIKVCQCFIVACCIGAFSTAPAIAVLLPVIVVSLIAATLPSLMGYLTNERICNVPSILPVRSLSYVAVAWTATICLVRSFAYSPESMQKTVIFASEGVIYVGWAVIYLVGFIWAYIIEKKMYTEWQLVLEEEGLHQAIQELTTSFETALIETDNQRNFLAQNEVLLTHYREKVQSCRSVQDIAILLLHLEDMIMVDKLSDSFLTQRRTWIKTVSEAHMMKLESRTTFDLEGQELYPAITTKKFQVILDQAAILKSAFRHKLVTTDLSRDVLTILLSNKLPRDVVWYIFNFLVRTNNLRRILTSVEADLYYSPPTLKGHKGKDYCSAMLDFSRRSLHQKSEKIRGEVNKSKL